MKISLILCSTLLISSTQCFHFIPENREVMYEYVGQVTVGARASIEDENLKPPPPSGWKVRGTLKLQRRDQSTIAAALAVEKVILNHSGQVFYQNKEIQPFYNPFKIVMSQDIVSHLSFKEKDVLWSINLKKAIASAFQVQGDGPGAFVMNEPSINGNCTTEYYISNKTDHLLVRKTPELNSCNKVGGIHFQRSNVPLNPCEFDFQQNVIIGNEAQYTLSPKEDKYYLNTAFVKGIAMVHTFESSGEAQYVSSELQLTYLKENDIVNILDIDQEMSPILSDLEFENPVHDSTGGRQKVNPKRMVKRANNLLISLADSLESADLKFDEPYDSTVAEIIKVMGKMNYECLQKLYQEIDIGTSYRQETVRNLFLELIPRIGTSAAVLLTRDLVVSNRVKSTTAVQLLISLPFHIAELSAELVTECEVLMNLGPDRPDVKQSAVLTFATLVYNAYVSRKIPDKTFEKYVKKYFELFMNGFDYEQKMVYLQGLSNLQLTKVADYLDPIIRDETQNEDTRFLAIWATIPLAHTRAEKAYETYWPILENRNASLPLRVAAFKMLLLSNPTPARLINLDKMMQDETNLHLLNYYRSTILSLSETTYPCYQHLKRIVSYILRHIPKAPSQRYWITGNYIYDYRHNQYGIGAILQTDLIGDEQTNLPGIFVFKFDTEALGKFTGQHTLYIKARGLTDAIRKRFENAVPNLSNKVRTLLDSLNLPVVATTPLHLEVIVQIEGKSVVSYFLNDKTFANLTDGDILNRINFILLSNSHINMQNIRWPFMLQYSMPTVLGTPAGVTIQSTVFSSLRGNITQEMAASKITRSNQIDARYNSYAVCKSETYNPFLNLEHTVHREQGFLVYIPINNELQLHDMVLSFSFYRPANLTGGFALRSRSLTTTKGLVLQTDAAPFSEVNYPAHVLNRAVPVEKINYEIKDLGLNFTAEVNTVDLGNHMLLLLNSDLKYNTRTITEDTIFDHIVPVVGMFQLNSIHIGNDKQFSLLVHNDESTKIDGQLVINLKEIDLNLNHKINDKVLHSWQVTAKLSEIEDSNKVKIVKVVKRVDSEKQQWKLCFEGIYEPLVFLKNPHTLHGSLVFGDSQNTKKCPKDKSRFDMTVMYGTVSNAMSVYDERVLEENGSCPREILRFDPPPALSYCSSEDYRPITAIAEFATRLKFSNMPASFENFVHRTERIISTFSSLERMPNLMDGLNISVKAPYYESNYELSINDEVFLIPNFNKYFDVLDQFDDVKFESGAYWSYHYGFERICSQIDTNLTTFDDTVLNTTELARDHNCWILLAADCSDQSRISVFTKPSGNGSIALKVYAGDDTIEYHPLENGEHIMTVNGENKFKLHAMDSKEISLLSTLTPIKISFNEENVLVLETENSMTVQYNLNNMLTFSVYSFYKEQICGLCAPSSNRNSDGFKLCS
ncbi:vitellogenin-3 [Bradysia coprophila]|uniref:vitellogenin-3 n=1 Tax=Bradysia coprophila TaxID=38358 RepID=UPI00187DBBCD|nr:vitellogenin-3 [Bradysia coprophila]